MGTPLAVAPYFQTSFNAFSAFFHISKTVGGSRRSDPVTPRPNRCLALLIPSQEPTLSTPNTTSARDSVRVATVPFAFSTWRYSPSTYSEKSRSPVTNHGHTTPMLGFSRVYRYPYGTSKPQTRPVDAISPFSNMAHSAPRRVA